MTQLPELPYTERFKLFETCRLMMIPEGPFSSSIRDWVKLRTIEQIERLTVETSHSDISTSIRVDAVNKVFTKSMHKNNRFNDDQQGAWYCAFKHDTAVIVRASIVL